MFINKTENTCTALKSNIGRKKYNRRTVHFFKKKCKILKRSPKYLRKSTINISKNNRFMIIKCPLTTEYAMKQIEEKNTLVFLVKNKATKRVIKNVIEEQYNIKISKCNTLIRPDGVKKAYIKLSSECDALDIANKIGII